MFGDANETMSTIPRFNQIQFEGFCRFIDRGLTEELYKFPKIEDTDHEIEFQLFWKDIFPILLPWTSRLLFLIR